MMLTWLVSVWLLDTTGRWRRLASGLGGELLTWGLATSGLACEICQNTVFTMARCCDDHVLKARCDDVGGACGRRNAVTTTHCDGDTSDDEVVVTYGLSAWYAPLQWMLMCC